MTKGFNAVTNKVSVLTQRYLRTLALVFCFLAVGSGTTIFANTIDVRNYGAKLDGTTDDTAAFQAAFDALPDRGVLTIPAGTAILTKKLVLQNKSAMIRGEGSGVTRLIWTNPGGIHLQESRTWKESKAQKASWEIRDIGFITKVLDGGTALAADFKTSDRLDPAFSVRDCRFEGIGAKAYWSKSIHGHNAHLGRVVACNFRGAASVTATTEAHIHLTGNSTSFVIDACHGMNSIYGVLVEGETEGVTISKCFFVHNRYGYVLNITDGGEPMFNVFQSHSASGVYPLWIKNGRSSSIVGNCFILQKCSKYEDGPQRRSGIRIEGKLAKDVIVSSCTIQVTDKDMKGAFYGVDAESVRGLILNNNTFANNSNVTDDCGINVGKRVKDAVISGNVFHLKSDTRYKVDSAATHVVIDSKEQ
jgi:hypothetical protein